uniref:SMP-LTD domain-containing protein n=1 Tax=Aegilops tauschii TaxID=37682 RepID=M8BJC8_AEGTA
MDAGDLSIVPPIGLVLLALWAAASFGCCHSVVFLIAFLYLYMATARFDLVFFIGIIFGLVNARCAMRLRKRIQHAEMKSAYQQRSKASVQELYMGRDSPIFTSMRVLPETSDDDHLVLLGVKFVRSWPFLGRLRLCFVEPPYFQMTVKPLVGHGLDVTEFPGISGWLDKLMDTAFGQTLVEPNMLVINMEKFSSTPSEIVFTKKGFPPL